MLSHIRWLFHAFDLQIKILLFATFFGEYKTVWRLEMFMKEIKVLIALTRYSFISKSSYLNDDSA